MRRRLRDLVSDQQTWVRITFVLAAVATIAAFVVQACESSRDEEAGPRSTTTVASTSAPTSSDPRPNECTTDERFERQVRLQAGTESGAAGSVDLGSVVGYTAGSHGSNQLSIELGGRVRGSAPTGYTLYLLAMPDATPDEEPPGQIPGDGRYYIATPNPFVEMEDGCWTYSRAKVGDGWCGQTTIFTIALIANAAGAELEEERIQPPYNFPAQRMRPPDVLKLATFDVSSIDACRPGEP